MALRKVFSVLPPRGAGNSSDDEKVRAMLDGQLEGYLIALQGCTFHALSTTVNRVIRGEIEGLSRKFCPTAPELSSAIRDEMDFVQKQIDLAKERMMIADNRPVAVVVPKFDERAAELRERMRSEGRALIFSVTSHDDFLRRRREMRKGYEYHAILGECYGPPGSAAATASDDVSW